MRASTICNCRCSNHCTDTKGRYLTQYTTQVSKPSVSCPRLPIHRNPVSSSHFHRHILFCFVLEPFSFSLLFLRHSSPAPVANSTHPIFSQLRISIVFSQRSRPSPCSNTCSPQNTTTGIQASRVMSEALPTPRGCALQLCAAPLTTNIPRRHRVNPTRRHSGTDSRLLGKASEGMR